MMAFKSAAKGSFKVFLCHGLVWSLSFYLETSCSLNFTYFLYMVAQYKNEILFTFFFVVEEMHFFTFLH